MEEAPGGSGAARLAGTGLWSDPFAPTGCPAPAGPLWAGILAHPLAGVDQRTGGPWDPESLGAIPPPETALADAAFGEGVRQDE